MFASERQTILSLPPIQCNARITSVSEIQDWGLRALNIPLLWQHTCGQGIKVAVLDTGCIDTHPDLQGRIVAAKDFTHSANGVYDKHGHGTHCAGIIAANRNKNGVVGVAPQADLLIAKVLDDSGQGGSRPIAAGVDWAVQQGADIISLSLGSNRYPRAIHNAIKRALARGVFVICAAGNDGVQGVDYPGALSETIAVGAIGQGGRIAQFSSRGDQVTIAAPGHKILSTYTPNGYAVLSGTSMATPFVAGVVALMLAKHRLYGGETPVNTQQQLIEHLQATARDIGAEGFDTASGWGLIDPARVVGKTPTPPPADRPQYPAPTPTHPRGFCATGFAVVRRWFKCAAKQT